MLKEKDVIFSLAVNAIKTLIENNMTFDCPEDSKNLLNDYSFQQSHIDTFIEDYCRLDINGEIYSAELYGVYKRFCEDNLVRPISQTMFSQKIGSLPKVENCKLRIADRGGKSARGFRGIALHHPPEQDSELYDNENKSENIVEQPEHLEPRG